MPMKTFKPTPEEAAAGHWDQKTIADAADTIWEDGVILLQGVANPEHCLQLSEKMLADLQQAQALGRIQNDFQGLRPPPCHPWLFADIVHNEWVIQITEKVLGPDLCNVAYGSNISYPESSVQKVHADSNHLWPNLLHPPCSLVVNIPLTNVTEANGATKIYPGSHRYQNAENFSLPTAKDLELWEQHRPSERACSQLGDILIRDVRMWHGGMPNTTPEPRIMIATIHHPEWLMGGFQAEAGSEDFFASHPRLRHRVEFVPKPMDYMYAHHSKPSFVTGVGGPKVRE